MKHTIITVICLITVFTLGVVSVNLYHNQKVQQHVAAVKAQAAQSYHDQLQKAAVKLNYDKANADCKKGQQAYDLQTAAYHKANPQRPLCDLQIVQ